MNKLVTRRETLCPLAPPLALDDEQLEKCAGGTDGGATQACGDPDNPTGTQK